MWKGTVVFDLEFFLLIELFLLLFNFGTVDFYVIARVLCKCSLALDRKSVHLSIWKGISHWIPSSLYMFSTCEQFHFILMRTVLCENRFSFDGKSSQWVQAPVFTEIFNVERFLLTEFLAPFTYFVLVSGWFYSYGNDSLWEQFSMRFSMWKASFCIFCLRTSSWEQF